MSTHIIQVARNEVPSFITQNDRTKMKGNDRTCRDAMLVIAALRKNNPWFWLTLILDACPIFPQMDPTTNLPHKAAGKKNWGPFWDCVKDHFVDRANERNPQAEGEEGKDKPLTNRALTIRLWMDWCARLDARLRLLDKGEWETGEAMAKRLWGSIQRDLKAYNPEEVEVFKRTFLESDKLQKALDSDFF